MWRLLRVLFSHTGPNRERADDLTDKLDKAQARLDQALDESKQVVAENDRLGQLVRQALSKLEDSRWTGVRASGK